MNEPTPGQLGLLVVSVALFAASMGLSLARIWRNTNVLRIAAKSCGYWGVLVGLGLVAFQEYRDTSFKTEDDIVRLLRLPVLGRIPLMVTSGGGDKKHRRRLTASAAGLAVVLHGLFR